MENQDSEANQSNRSSASINLNTSLIENFASLIQSKKDSLNDVKNKQNQQSTNKRSPGNSDAIFLGWQRTPFGDTFALYNVINPRHPFFGSTVSEITLQKLNLRVPPTPRKTEY